jgi:hypothetical protein
MTHRHSGASRSDEPEIHNHISSFLGKQETAISRNDNRLWLWIPGSRASRTPE